MADTLAQQIFIFQGFFVSISHMAKVFDLAEELELIPGELCTLLKLADHANHKAQCWPSKQQIAHKTNQGVRTVERHISGFVARGIIISEIRTRGGRKYNFYTLNLGGSYSPEPAEAPPKPTKKETTVHFADFWQVYPVGYRKNKPAALKAWKRKNLDKDWPAIQADLAKRPKADDTWIKGYICNPATYLNGERWNDSYTPIKAETTTPEKPRSDADWQKLINQNGLNARGKSYAEVWQDYLTKVKTAA